MGLESMVIYRCVFNTALATDGRMRSTAEDQGALFIADRLGTVEPSGFNVPAISFLGGKHHETSSYYHGE